MQKQNKVSLHCQVKADLCLLKIECKDMIKDYRIPKTCHSYSFLMGKNAMLNMAAQL